MFTITVPAEQEGAARALVTGMAPSARLTYSVGGTLKFELPTSEVRRQHHAPAHHRWRVHACALPAAPERSCCRHCCAVRAARDGPCLHLPQVSLSRVFATMAGSAASGLVVLDWGVANATLEEVFIRFARQIGAKGGG